MNFKRIPPHQICRPTLSAAWSFQICGFRVLLALFVAGFRFLFLDSSYGERCTTKWGASTEFSTMSVSLTSHKSSFTIFIDDVVFVVLVYTAGCVSDVRLQLNNLLWWKQHVIETAKISPRNWPKIPPYGMCLFHICFTWRQKRVTTGSALL